MPFLLSGKGTDYLLNLYVHCHLIPVSSLFLAVIEPVVCIAAFQAFPGVLSDETSGRLLVLDGVLHLVLFIFIFILGGKQD